MLPCLKNKHIQKVNKLYLFSFLIAWIINFLQSAIDVLGT